MRPFIRSLSWYLYGGVSCYCAERLLVDFVHVQQDLHESLQSGDILILDVWNRFKFDRNELIYATSPDNHRQTIFGRVIALPGESINTKPPSARVKLVKIPKGSVAVNLLNVDNRQEIKILPQGLIEGRVLARVWPLKRYSNHLLHMPPRSSDI